MTVCYTCGGDYDVRFVTTPCPECGRIKGLLPDEVKAVDVVKYKEPNIKNDLIVIPDYYKGLNWSKDLLIRDYTEEYESSNQFRHLVQTMDKAINIFRQGGMLDKSLILIAPPHYSKVTWAYSIMQSALENGLSVAPLLDSREVEILLNIDSRNPNHRVFGSLTYSDYIMKDIVFITITKTEYRTESYKIIQEVLDSRSRKGLPTYFISRFTLKEMAQRDWKRHFQFILTADESENILKYPAVVTYNKKIEGDGLI